MTLDIREDTVTETASLLNIARLEGEAQALSRGIRFVNRHVAPPYTAVIPQVVVEVIIVDTKRDFGLLRCHFDGKMLEVKCELPDSQGIRVRFGTLAASPYTFIQETQVAAATFKKNPEKILVEDTGLLQRVVSTILGDGAQGLAGKLHANETTLAAVELGHPDTLLLKVRIYRAVHHLGDVTTDTALLLGKTGAMNAAAFVRHGKRDIADSGHKILR